MSSLKAFDEKTLFIMHYTVNNFLFHHNNLNDHKMGDFVWAVVRFVGNPPENCNPVQFPSCFSNSKTVSVLIDLLVVVFNCWKAAGTSGYCYGP